MKKNLLSLIALVSLGASASATEQVEVIASRQVADGVTQQVVRNEKGQQYKRFVGVNAPQGAQQSNDDPVVGDTIFYESFEGFATEGKDLNWIPSTWSKKIAPGNEPTAEMISHNINNSWYCYYTGDGQFTPKSNDGECDAYIHYGYKNAQYNLEPVAQDEWLISPVVNMNASGEYYLDFLLAASYFDCYDVNNDWDWNKMQFNKRVVVNTMKVMTSTDEGKTWNEVFDLAKDVIANRTDRECYDTEFTSYLRYQINVSELAGKNAKFAFRYVRDEGEWMGNSMAVDAVKVLHKEPTSINDVKDAAPVVTKIGNTFTVNTNAQSVAVYNIAGQKIAEKSLAADKAINASEWANGIYILRLSNGTAVKVAK